MVRIISLVGAIDGYCGKEARYPSQSWMCGWQTRTMRDIVALSIAQQNFDMQLLSIFGASALLLAAVGIYGLMSYSVQQRAQEIGVRMALGADRQKIRNMVMWQGMRLALAGAVSGTGAALTFTHLIASFLFGVKS
jgi:ABC-type antimicrobial peptide transport system permease subunit